MTTVGLSARWERRPDARHPQLDRWAAGAAIAALAVWMAAASAESRRIDEAPATGEAAGRAAGEKASAGVAGPEVMIGAYGGAPYTYPSDVRFHRAAAPPRDMTVEGVEWEGRPFKSPIYYGARVVRWGESGTLGGMVDFVHSKAISRMAQEVRLSGTLDGRPVPERARIADIFEKLEFSHGHNMLMLTGLARLGRLTPSLAPYVGVGAGISLPHSEIHIKTNDPHRSYEYQMTGPVAQALAGLEIRLPRVSVFIEYKFSFASYSAPLTHREGTILPVDLFLQAQRWWSGAEPPGGFADTRLVSHQLIGGIGVRLESFRF